MKTQSSLALLVALPLFLSACLTPAKLDKYVAAQYNNELPKPGKKKRAEIDVVPAAARADISTTVHKTDKFLPLLVYWKYNHRQQCSLNPAIAVTQFSNAVQNAASKTFTDKLAGRKLELTVDQAPAGFSMVLKENMVWVVYAFAWAKIYVEPEAKDLVVSYKLTDAGQAVKTGTITVKNNERKQGLTYFQSWKSATAEYIQSYNADMNIMAKSFLNQLAQEL